jgi:recombination protein RecA
VIDLGTEMGILEKSGAWIGYGSERLGNGREAAKQHLTQNPVLMAELRRKLLEQAGIVKDARPAPVAATITPTAVRAKAEKPEPKAAPSTKAA